MRFEQFISSASFVHNHQLDEYGISSDCLYAIMYPGGSHILRADGDDGSWCLTIGNESEISNDLLRLEAQLYCWAAEEGHFDKQLTNDMLFDWMIQHSVRIYPSSIDPTENVCQYTSYNGEIHLETNTRPSSAIISAWCKDTVREYFDLINLSTIGIGGL